MSKKIFIFFLINSLFLFTSCQYSKNKEYLYNSGEVFHTLFHIKYKAPYSLNNEIQEALLKLDQSANPFNTESLLYAINHNTSTSTDLILQDLWSKSFLLYQKSDKAYDVTIAPLVNFWGFGVEKDIDIRENIQEKKIDSILTFIGMDKVQLTDSLILKSDSRIQIDFSSIAKGYACDLVANSLEKADCKNYLVEIGGEIAFKGKNLEGTGWKIGINKPLLDKTGLKHYTDFEIIIELPKEGIFKGLATSGNYRNYKVRKDGTLYAHTINPLTGYPIQTDILSATILTTSSSWADAIATMCMVVGSKKAISILERMGNIEYFFILGDSKNDKNSFKIIASEGFLKLQE